LRLHAIATDRAAGAAITVARRHLRSFCFLTIAPSVVRASICNKLYKLFIQIRLGLSNEERFARGAVVSNLQFVLGRIESGARIRILQDVYGREKVVVRRAWLPLHTRVSLRREEMTQVKAALSARANVSRQMETVRI
jgi:hypothetical protein